jgi:hypothetical protein
MPEAVGVGFGFFVQGEPCREIGGFEGFGRPGSLRTDKRSRGVIQRTHLKVSFVATIARGMFNGFLAKQYKFPSSLRMLIGC